MQIKNKDRKNDLDFLRALAIIAVVVIHSIAPVVRQKPIGSTSWIVANIIDSFMRWGVPIFVMISGALLIKKENFYNSKNFFKKRFKKILIPLLSWPVIYVAWWKIFFMDKSLDFVDFVKQLLSGKPAFGYQLYFLFIILGLYLLTPLLSLYVSSVTKRRLWIATLAILSITTAHYSLEYFIFGRIPRLNLFTLCLPYVGYFLLGYTLKDIKIKSYTIPTILFFLASSLITLLTYFGIKNNQTLFFYEYPSIFVIIASATLYVLFKNVYTYRKRVIPKKLLYLFDGIVQSLSLSSFGIFLVHMIVLKSVIRLFDLDAASIVNAIIIAPVVLILSWVFTILVKKIPKINLLVG